jgi:dihydrolipoamide dehydrogenase
VGFDVAVIGSGPGGFYCALACAQAGLNTALVERDRLGGTGFRWGCLPVKIMLDSLRRGERCPSRRVAGAAVLADLRRSLPRIESHLNRRLADAGVQIIFGEARLRGPRQIEVGERRIETRALVLATGSEPSGWPGVPLGGRACLSHRDLLALPRLPRRLLVLGGDVEGIELACLLSRLRVRVTVIEKEPEILPGQDRDLVAPVEQALRAFGVSLLTGCAVSGSRAGPRGLRVELDDGRRLAAPAALLTGLRRPNLPEGLEAAGVRLAPGGAAVAVDAALQSSCPDVYAVGDVNGLSGMAHAAIEQGLRVARVLAGQAGRSAAAPRAYAGLARALFTLPEIAGAGLQERELQARGVAYHARRVGLGETWRGLVRGSRRGLVRGLVRGSGRAEGFAKVLSSPEGRVLGMWICAPEASEMAAHFGLLLDKDLSVDELAHGLPIHPTLGEALLEAALQKPQPGAAEPSGAGPQGPAGLQGLAGPQAPGGR